MTLKSSVCEIDEGPSNFLRPEVYAKGADFRLQM